MAKKNRSETPNGEPKSEPAREEEPIESSLQIDQVAETPTPDEVPDEVPDDESKLFEFHVVGPGSLYFKGENLGPASVLMITKAEAKMLGDVVAPGAPNLRKVKKLEGGIYVVNNFGTIYKDRKNYLPGQKILLTAEEAKEFAERIDPI